MPSVVTFAYGHGTNGSTWDGTTLPRTTLATRIPAGTWVLRKYSIVGSATTTKAVSTLTMAIGGNKYVAKTLTCTDGGACKPGIALVCNKQGLDSTAGISHIKTGEDVQTNTDIQFDVDVPVSDIQFHVDNTLEMLSLTFEVPDAIGFSMH